MSLRNKKTIWRNAVTLGLVAVSVVLLVVGAKNGGLAEVIQKARFICLECIGIG